MRALRSPNHGSDGGQLAGQVRYVAHSNHAAARAADVVDFSAEGGGSGGSGNAAMGFSSIAPCAKTHTKKQDAEWRLKSKAEGGGPFD